MYPDKLILRQFSLQGPGARPDQERFRGAPEMYLDIVSGAFDPYDIRKQDLYENPENNAVNPEKKAKWARCHILKNAVL